jgi:hypothetical protein
VIDSDAIESDDAAGAAVGAAALGSAPVAAREVDPELPAHWLTLLAMLDRHDSRFGAHAVLSTVRRELRLIARHRQIARGALRTESLAVEALDGVRGLPCQRHRQRTGPGRLDEPGAASGGPGGRPDAAALTRMRQAQSNVLRMDLKRLGATLAAA